MIKKRNSEKPLVGPVDKKYLPNEAVVAQNAAIVHEANQKIQKELQPKPEVPRDIYSRETTQILFFADWHIGSGTVDFKAINERLKYAEENDNVMVVFLGDVLEAMKTQYASTIVVQTHSNVTTQVAQFRSMVRKLNEQGKILTMVSGYGGHSGSWVAEGSTYDIYQSIRGDYPIPLIQPGGRLTLRFIDPDTNKLIGVKKLDLYHAPPSGSGARNLTGGLVNAIRQMKSRRPDVAASGHIHKGAFSVELDPHGNQIIAIQEGTPKGSNPNLPADNMFLEKVAGKRPHPAGSALTMRTKGGTDDIALMPTYGQRRTDLANQAFSLLDYLEQNKLTAEVVGDIQRITGEKRPEIRFDARASRKDDNLSLLETRELTEKDVANEANAEIPSPVNPEDQWALMSYRVITSLPLLWMVGGHFGFGGNSSSMSKYQEMRSEFIKSIENNPHAVLLLMRGLMDTSVPGRADRRMVVKEIEQSFKKIGEQGKLLGIMLSGGDFRSERWRKSVGKDAPFMPGSHLAEGLNSRLYNNMSTIELVVGSRNNRSLPHYRMLTVDKVGQHGSRGQTFNGLRAMDSYSDEEHDFVAGGHMPGAGVMYAQDPYSATPERIYIAPGHYDKWRGQGKGNQMDAAPGGQGVIVLPKEKLAFPVADLDDAMMQHLALYALLGAREAKILDKILSDTR